MAKRNGKDVAAGATRSVGDRQKAIAGAVKELYAIQCKIDAATEKHVAPYREDMKAIRQRLRDEFQVPTKVLNARLSTYKIEKEGDDDITAALAEIFEALPLGHQLDMFKDRGKTAENSAPVTH